MLEPIVVEEKQPRESYHGVGARKEESGLASSVEDKEPRPSLAPFVRAVYQEDEDPLSLSGEEVNCAGLSFICDLCGLLQASLADQQTHMKVCRKRKTSRPRVAGVAVKRRRRCDVGEGTSVRNLTCAMCGKVLSSGRTLRAHMYVHNGESEFVDPLYACDKCDSRFPHYSSLKKHKMIHSGKKPFACDKCSFRCNQRSSLKEHLRVHSGERPYMCDVCGGSFTQKNTLMKHRLIHTGERHHACDTCDARFTQKNTLVKHRRTHTGERPYACGDCDARFTQGCSLAKHKRMHVESPYACARCRARFPTVESLSEHALIHTRERKHVCEACGLKFECRSKLVRHALIHCRKFADMRRSEANIEDE